MEDFIDSLIESEPVFAGPVPAKPATSLLPVPPITIASPIALAKPTYKSSPAKTVSEQEDGKIEVCTTVQHFRTKGMWAGALSPLENRELRGVVPVAGNLQVIELKQPQTPALLKIIDEIIVNATDHAKGLESGNRGRVTRINIAFDKDIGSFRVYNDGPGIPATLHAGETKTAGRNVYAPEVAFARGFAGSNITKSQSNVKGGINGLGAKLANVHSTWFKVETVNTVYYSQMFRNRLDVIELPQVLPISDAEACGLDATQHTQVSFLPAYSSLGYAVSSDGLPSSTVVADIDAWLRLRAHLVAAYIGHKVSVTYNQETCQTTNASALARLMLTQLPGDASEAVILNAVMKSAEPANKPHSWDVAVIVLPAGKNPRGFKDMGIINGVPCNRGSHMSRARRLLSDAVENELRKATKQRKRTPKTPAKASAKTPAKASAKSPAKSEEKAMSMTETLAGVRVIVCGALPSADWGGQRKDELQAASAGSYEFTATFLKQIGLTVAQRNLLGSEKKRTKFVHDKYVKATYSGGPKRMHTLLLAAEGDSAITLLRAGLTQKKTVVPPGGPSTDWVGYISVQGVVMNTSKQVTSIAASDGSSVLVRSAKFQENKRLAAVADAFGLQYGRKYTTAAELATLNYGKLIVCVDADVDGAGKIAPLILVWLYTFWPALFEAGRIGRFMTPLMRAYPRSGGAPIEFLYEEEASKWLSDDEARGSKYTIKYYKGLAAHSEAEAKLMFTPDAFARSIYIFSLDERTRLAFEVYFGHSSRLRKIELLSPVKHLPFDEMKQLIETRKIPVGRVQLDVDTKIYKLEAIRRQIPHAVDGLNPTRRKILTGVRMRFAKGGAALKVFQLGGYISYKVMYHHGEKSLNNTIMSMAQAFPGANKYPHLIGVGQFGNRHGDEAGSARYVGVKPSPLIRVAYPPEDRWHLKYVFVDGQRAEPCYFVPVVPMVCMESHSIVSEAWNHDSFGRDLPAVLKVVRAYIGGNPALHAAAERLEREGPTEDVMRAIGLLSWSWPLPVCQRNFTGEIRIYRREYYSFGWYTWSADTRQVRITELPMGVTTQDYLSTLTASGRGGAPNPRSEWIESVADRCTPDKIDLLITLRPGAFEKIESEFGDESIHPIEDALLLRASLRPHLNYYGANNAVLEFGECYLASILYWAPFRRRLYADRLARDRIVTGLLIVEAQQINRYAELAAEFDIAKDLDSEAAAKRLVEHKFVRLDSALLHRPEYTPNADIERLVLEGPSASYDYILNLRARDLLSVSVAKRAKAIAEHQARLADILRREAEEKPFPGASLWLDEIAEFVKVVDEGVRTSWQFGSA